MHAVILNLTQKISWDKFIDFAQRVIFIKGKFPEFQIFAETLQGLLQCRVAWQGQVSPSWRKWYREWNQQGQWMGR